MKSKIADRIINNTGTETIDKVDQYVLKTIEMNKELEQKTEQAYKLVDEFVREWKKENNTKDAVYSSYHYDCMVAFAVKFAQQNTLTLDTKLDENGEEVGYPISIYYKPDFGCQKHPQECYEFDLERYEKARTVKEWIEYAKELEGLIDQIYTTTNIYSHPFEAISKIQKLTAKTK